MMNMNSLSAPCGAWSLTVFRRDSSDMSLMPAKEYDLYAQGYLKYCGALAPGENA